MNSRLCVVLVCATMLATCFSDIESAAILAAPTSFVTAHSSQVVARNYNGFAAPLVTAPLVTSLVSAPVAAVPSHVSAPLVAYNPYYV